MTDERLKLAGHVVFRALSEDEGALLDVNEKLLFGLNGTALFLLKKLESGVAPARLPAALSREFAVDESAARADVKAFVEELRSRGLVEG